MSQTTRKKPQKIPSLDESEPWLELDEVSLAAADTSTADVMVADAIVLGDGTVPVARLGHLLFGSRGHDLSRLPDADARAHKRESERIFVTAGVDIANEIAIFFTGSSISKLICRLVLPV